MQGLTCANRFGAPALELYSTVRSAAVAQMLMAKPVVAGLILNLHYCICWGKMQKLVFTQLRTYSKETQVAKTNPKLFTTGYLFKLNSGFSHTKATARL